MMIYSPNGKVLINGARVDYFEIGSLIDHIPIYATFGEIDLTIGTYASSDEAHAALHRINAAIIRKEHTFVMPKYGFLTEEARERI